MKSRMQELLTLGQSLWFDNIQRRLLIKSPEADNSELAAMIDRGDIRGITSNPSIFNNAIAKTTDYDSALIPLAWSGLNAEQIFWQLALEDIREACDLFSNLYNQTSRDDGYVSLEVSPVLAHDTQGTLELARQLWKQVSRPNLMIKIPATQEGLPAIRDAIAEGININVTLIFSIERYRAVTDSFLAGLEARIKTGLPIDQIASVASFFVSRMDTKVDGLLPQDSMLRGKSAIAYTKLAYQEFLKVFGSERFLHCQKAGGHLQRPLWASTSTKNPSYPDTIYINSLIGPDTVDTVPPQTLEAFRDHGVVSPTLLDNIEDARKVITDLEELGISMDQVTQELEFEGVKTFSEAFTAMLKTIEEGRTTAVRSLGPLADKVKECVSNLIETDTPSRLWAHDPTLWTADPSGQEEVRKRMGWLDLPISSRHAVKEINDFVFQVGKDGFSNALLLGMGGSSLAPEVFSLLFPSGRKSGMVFSILDSTDPAQVLATDHANPPEKTLYIISSKSGGTAEISAMFSYFWERSGKNGSHFVAITDPGTSLEELAKANSFRKIFHADSTVGGRYSALTHFGLVPAALMGIDVERLLGHANGMMRQCEKNVIGTRNPGLVLGAILGQAAKDGRDKLTFLADKSVAPVGAWLEQLIAESSGKLGKGIIPVVGEKVIGSEGYSSDRLFIYLRREGERDETVKALLEEGQPTLVFNMVDEYDLGEEIYRWEYSTAVACSVLGMNAFDQPDVQDAKERTKTKIIAYNQTKNLNQGISLWEKDGIAAFSSMHFNGMNLEKTIMGFLDAAGKGGYVAINAFLPRNPETAAILADLRSIIQFKTRCATTVGFGPRFLHSTGQLHKGGPANGLFLQITADSQVDLEIPGQGMSFGTLERAQALGDYEALAARGRRILRLNFPSINSVNQLVTALRQSS